MSKAKLTIVLVAMSLSGCSDGCSEYRDAAPDGRNKFGLIEAKKEMAIPSMDIRPAPSGKPVAPPSEAVAEAADAAADAAEAAGDAAAQASGIPAGDIKVSLPQIAYSYQYGYRIAAAKIPDLQNAHADLCESKGPKVCHILNLSQQGGEGDYASAQLQIEVAAPVARAFGDEMSKMAESKGGDPISTSIQGEDLTKQIVDTEARLRARTLLRDRLMEILRTRSGKVSELVEAERGVAEVNEEIDQARSWLAEMKGRVAFSKMTISYQSGVPTAGGFMEPIRYALGNAGAMLGGTIAFLISAFIFLLPWAALLAGLLWLKRRFGWSWRFWRRTTGYIAEPEES